MDLSRADELLLRAIAGGITPGACYAVGRGSGEPILGSFGRHTYSADSPLVAPSTLWDLASLTKVVATTSAIMLLCDEGLLELEAPVSSILPEFGQSGKAGITIRNLLVHNSGLAAFHRFHEMGIRGEGVFPKICEEPPSYPTGDATVYSDLGFITLGKVIEAVSGQALDSFVESRILGPLGLTDTSFNPALPKRARCAPTERVEEWRAKLRQERGIDTPEVFSLETDREGNRWIQGEVHDPTAMLMGGVAGHAGLFSSVSDLSMLVQVLMQGGGGLIEPDTIASFTTRASDDSSRALGWDTPSPGSSAGRHMSPKSFGHTGFTGTSIWVDPERDLFAILLTNRVHPTAETTGISDLRIAFHDSIRVPNPEGVA